MGLEDDDGYVSTAKLPPEALFKRFQEMAGREYGTQQGMMLLRGQLTKRQYAACNWFEQVYERYLAAIGKSRGIRTSTGERYDRGHDPDPLSSAGQEMASAEQMAVREYKSARLAALGAGNVEFGHFWDTVIEGKSNTAYGRFCVANVAALLDKHRMRGWKSRRSTR